MCNDLYELLGLTKAATADDIKKAYRKLVRTSHPDLHPDDAGAETRFKTISAAYEILKDPETRAQFDAGEIDGLCAQRLQRQYYCNFAGAADNSYQQGRGFGRDAIPLTSSQKSCAIVRGRPVLTLPTVGFRPKAQICAIRARCRFSG